MNFRDSNDFFCNITLKKKLKTEKQYIVAMTCPILLKPEDSYKVALFEAHYVNTSQLFRNLANSTVQIACPGIIGLEEIF